MTDNDPILSPTPEQDFPDTVEAILQSGDIEAAIGRVSKATYSPRSGSQDIRDLRAVLAVLKEGKGGAKAAVELVNALIPRVSTGANETDWQKKEAASFYDFMVQDLVITALQQKDFETAAEVVDRMDDWYIGAAMGGDDLLELGYRADDPAILASVWALIAKRWGNGRAATDIPTLAPSISDSATIDAINGWLDETSIEFRIK